MKWIRTHQDAQTFGTIVAVIVVGLFYVVIGYIVVHFVIKFW